MSTKRVEIDGIGTVALYRRRGTRQIRLSVTGTNEVRVTMPTWAPYRMGVEFVRSKADWIRQQFTPSQHIVDGMPVGKAHHFRFERTDSSRASARVAGNVVLVKVPLGTPATDEMVQAAAKRAGIKALKREAETLLPQRLQQLANTHNFSYASIAVKPLKGRWGSCSSQQDIILNCYLMQLPWRLIDYVILHELAHTRIMAHGQEFWDEVARYVPGLPAIRKEMRSHKPDFFTATPLVFMA